MTRVGILIIFLFSCLFMGCGSDIVEKDLSIMFKVPKSGKDYIGISYIIDKKEEFTEIIYTDSFIVQEILATNLKNKLFKGGLHLGWSCELDDTKTKISFSDIERIFNKAFQILEYKRGDEKKAMNFFIKNYFRSEVIMVNNNPNWGNCEEVYYSLINSALESNDKEIINELSLIRGLDVCQLEELGDLVKKNTDEFSKSKFIITFSGCFYEGISLDDDDILLENKPYFQVEFLETQKSYLNLKITLLNPLSLFKSLEL